MYVGEDKRSRLIDSMVGQLEVVSWVTGDFLTRLVSRLSV